LYKLLRSELVRTNPTALSSDAFSFFGKLNSDIYNKFVPIHSPMNTLETNPNKLNFLFELTDPALCCLNLLFHLANTR